MASYRGRFVYQSRQQPTTAGKAVDVAYDAVENPSSFDVILGVANFGSPLPILTAATTEGTTFPFFTRFLLGTLPPLVNQKFHTALFLGIVQDSTRWLGTSLPIVEAPPDETPLVTVREFTYPGQAFKRKLDASLRMAAAAQSDAPGSWIFSIPATEYSVPVCELLSEIQGHLLEIVNGGASFSSGLWTVTEVLNYLNHRMSRFLMETGIIQFRTTQAAAASAPFYDLPTDLIDLRRVAWTEGSTTRVLPRADSFTADIGFSSWDSSGGVSQVHLLVPEQSLEIRLAPVSSTAGTLDFIYVKNASAVTNDCSIMPFPDEWIPFLKWGVLADMLSKEGEANDPARAKYAEGRYAEGVMLARLYMGVSN